MSSLSCPERHTITVHLHDTGERDQKDRLRRNESLQHVRRADGKVRQTSSADGQEGNARLVSTFRSFYWYRRHNGELN